MRIIACFVVVLATLATAIAGIQASAGPYRITLTTQPGTIPVGQAKVIVDVADTSGKPVEGLTVRGIARMPGMFMGEREQPANAVPGTPGRYAMQAAFPMAGAYEVALKIDGPSGSASVVVPVSTGQNTASSQGGFDALALLPWAVGLALIAFVVLRMRRQGMAVHWKGVLNRGTIGGALLLAGLFALSVYAVNNMRRQGAMTPLEAQVMEMNTPAPPGTTAVRLGRVTRESIADTVSYSGQAVGFVEQDVNPRVQGVIQWMPVYVGDRVKKGQVLARLDTSQLDPQLAERSAMADMANQGVGVASAEYETALQEAVAARAEVAAREGMVGEADAMLAASRQEREAVEAELAAVRTDVTSAEAEVSAMEAEARFRAEELRRSRELFAKGAISKSELEQSQSEDAAADAKLRQARSMQRQAETRVTAAVAQLRKADAMVAAAQRRLRQAEADVRAAKASVLARESAARASKQNIAKERAAAAQARAGLQGAAAQLGYSSIEAEVDGVVTERLVSPGVLVNPGQTILRVAQISPIRIQANIPTGDLTRIARGSAVSILVGEGSAEPVRSRVSSVSQSVDARARTGIVEAVLPNTDARFMPGQFVEMRVEVGRATSRLTVPIEAVYRRPSAQGQEAAFVWVADQSAQAGTYAVRRVEVTVGASDGKRVAVEGELTEGQNVVTYGGAYLREGGEVTSPKEDIAAKGPVVEVMSTHYMPDTVEAKVGKPITITFVRRTEEGCGTEVSFPELGIEKPLPLNTPVEVTFTPKRTGEIKFTCAMDMFRGKVVVR